MVQAVERALRTRDAVLEREDREAMMGAVDAHERTRLDERPVADLVLGILESLREGEAEGAGVEVDRHVEVADREADVADAPNSLSHDLLRPPHGPLTMTVIR